MHPMLEAGDVLVGDRAFGSYAHLVLLLQSQLHGVFRVHQRLIVDFTPGRKAKKQKAKRRRTGTPSSYYLKRLGGLDQNVEYIKPKTRPKWMTREQYAQLPGAVTVRELRYTIAGSLSDEK